MSVYELLTSLNQFHTDFCHFQKPPQVECQSFWKASLRGKKIVVKVSDLNEEK